MIIMKKFLCAVVLMLVLPVCAFSEDISSTDISGVSAFTIQRDMGNSIGFRTLDGLQAVYLGTFRAKPEEQNTESEDAAPPDEGIFSVFMVKSDKDTQLKLDIRDGIDIRTNKFSYRAGKWGYVADSQVNGIPRDIPAGFWVRVTFWHTLPFKYGERPLIARVGFIINGNEITFKRIRPRPWGDWTYIEREYAAPLEEDRRRVEFEEMEIKPAK